MTIISGDTAVFVGPRLGSDHKPVVIKHSGRMFVTWNAQVGRDASAVFSEIGHLILHYKPQAFMLQECSGYLATLGSLPGYRLIVGKAHGDSQTAILVHTNVDSGPGFSRTMAKGWRANHFLPRGVTSVKIHGGPRLTSVHLPQNKGALRRLSRYSEMRRLRRFIADHPSEQITAGDWNATPEDRGPYSPAWLARRTGADIISTRFPTHAHHAEPIDFALINRRKK